MTHVIASAGGFLSIADDKHHEFQEQYATEAQRDDTSFALSELPSDGVFPMFFQVNHLDKHGLTEEGRVQICKVVIGVLGRYYSDHGMGSTVFEAVSFPTSSEEVVINDSAWTKRGFSLVFHNLFVTREDALQLRHTVVCELDGQIGSLECPKHQWSDAISREVYTIGMAMYGKIRSVPCTNCSNTEPMSGAEQGTLKELENKYVALRRKLRPMMSAGYDYGSLSNIDTIEVKSTQFNQVYLKLLELRSGYVCSFCSGSGRRTEKNQSPLTPIALDGCGSVCATTTDLLQSRADGLEILRRTTIRAPSTQEKTPGFLKPIDTPACPSEATADLLRESGDLRKSRRGKTDDLFAEALNSDVYEEDFKSLLGWKGKEDQITHPLTVKTIQDFIRSMGSVDGAKPYANVWVKGVYPEAKIKQVHVSSGMKIVKSIMEHGTGETYVPPKTLHLKKLWIRVQGRGSCYCMNRRGHHESNSIYFEMGPGKCWQRCFCTDDTEGAFRKTCQKYNTVDRGGKDLPSNLLKLFNSDPAERLSASSPAMPVVQLDGGAKRTVLLKNGKKARLSKKTQANVAQWDKLAKR